MLSVILHTDCHRLRNNLTTKKDGERIGEGNKEGNDKRCGNLVSLSPMAFATLSIMDWDTNVNTYRRIIENGFSEQLRPKACLSCQDPCFQQRHACFIRTLYTLKERICLVIYRFYCPGCGITYSVLPAFLRPHHTIAIEVQEEVIQSIDKGKSAERAGQDIGPGITVDPKTVRRWKDFWGNLIKIHEKSFAEKILILAPHITLPVGEEQKAACQTPLRWLSYLWKKAAQLSEIMSPSSLFCTLRRFSVSAAVSP